MLWYGTSASGTPTYGVSPVEVTARTSDDASPFAVDMTKAGAAGAQWQTAAWTAATVGSMLAGADPRGLTIAYHVTDGIDGPSAGAVLATAVRADLTASAELSDDVTMTGTVLPSGAVGPVGGIPAKLRAAADAGMNTVLIPRGQGIAIDPVSGRRVAVTELAAELDITVAQVDSVQNAIGYFTSPDDLESADPVSPTFTSPPVAPDVDMAPDVDALFANSARAALPALIALPITSPPDPALAGDWRRVSDGVALAGSRASSLLEDNRAIEAYARVTLAERETRAWNARAQTFADALIDPKATAAELSAQATDLAAAADAAIMTTAAQTPTTYVEQAAALPDVLSWATDSWTVATMLSDRLSPASLIRNPSPADLAAAAAVLASAQYDLDTYLPFSAQVAAQVGRTPVTDPGATADMLAAYADLLADTGNAITGDAQRAQTASTPDLAEILADPLTWEYVALTTLAQRWQRQQADAEVAATTATTATTADIAPASSTAMSFYVAASTWAATSQLAGAAGSTRGFSPTDWTTQVDVASSESLRSAGIATSQGLDPDYLAWNEGFGRSVAIAADAIGATDAIRLNGLQVQWYGNVQGYILVALAGTATHR